ncbi:hypothetical protein IJ182_09675 [bacterium]|nr:hypothetical protein [bacterium]
MAAELFGSTVSTAYDNTGSSTGTSYNYYRRYREQIHEDSIFTNTIEVETTSRDAVLQDSINNFAYYLENGYEDKAMAAYQELIEQMKAQPEYTDRSDKELQAYAKRMIEQQLSEQKGEEVDLVKYIKDHAASQSELDWQQHCNLFNQGIIDKTTEEDLLNAVCGLDEDKNGMPPVVHVLGAIPGFFASLWNGIAGKQHA